MENTPPQSDSADPTPSLSLTLDDIYTAKIFEAARLQQPQWMQDSGRFSYVDRAPESETNTLWLYEVATGARTVVIPEAALQLAPEDRVKPFPQPGQIETEEREDPEQARKRSVLTLSGYQWSPDEKLILISHLPQRRASHGDVALFVFDVAAQTLQRVTPERHKYRNVKWSPDSRSLGYVREDNLYRLDLDTGVETRLTDTARAQVYNGRLGWVYEEEIELADGWAWSPDGRRIAYYQQDETHVPQVDLPNYDALHMTPRQTRYPKAGDPNPLVRIGVLELPPLVADATVPATRWIDLGEDTDIYLARMQWIPDGRLLLQRIPRLQNRLDLLLADPQTGETTLVLTEEDAAWVDTPGEVMFVGETDQFLWLSDRSGWRHLYLYDLTGKLHAAVTGGEWEVERLAAIDSARRFVYFTAGLPTALERQMFVANLDDGGLAEPAPFLAEPGVHAPLFSPDTAFFLDTYSNRSTAPQVTLHRASGEAVATVLTNPMPKLQGRKTAEWSFTTFKTSDGVTLNAALLYPTDFDPTRTYPVLMYTYGGPGSQVALDSYGNGGGLEQWLVQEGYLLAMVDGRGSGMRGCEFKKIIYLNLGQYEVNDQIEGAKWLAGLPFVDAARIGIWGWSYGGYMASLCILRGADVFRAAVAVAPVTHWTLYDSIYTERYMRRPIDNPTGYANTSPLTLTDKLKGRFLLVHGTADDNVHFQNAARLAAAFQKGNKPFQTMFYPGKHHGIEGVSLHVFTLITTFIREHL